MRKSFTLLLLILSLSGVASAQRALGPGGVRGPEVWLETAPVSEDLQGTYHLKDIAGDSAALRLYDSRGPLSGMEYTLARDQVQTYNFNPAMDLSEAYASKNFLVGKTNLSQATIISVWGPADADFNQDMFLYSLNGRAGNGYIFSKDKLIPGTESGKSILDYGKTQGKDLLYQPTDTEPNINVFRERALRIATYTQALRPATGVWGEPNNAVISIGEIFHPEYKSINTSTYNMGSLNNRTFYGYTPEFIIYNRVLTPLERRKAETYLAIKYGLTLDRSYIGSDDQLLWDIDANQGYNTRVTGYGRSNSSGLYQKMSTTSYEEAPYYSDYNDIYDSYDLNNSYNLSSRYRLLTMGREQGNPIPDNGYVIFGDNNMPLPVAADTTVSGIKLMPRRWLVDTNIASGNDETMLMRWNTSGLDTYTNEFKTKATKTGTASDEYGYMVTDRPLIGSDGNISWTITSPRLGPLTIKFGTDNPVPSSGSNDYGYYINEAGTVFKIIKGVRQTIPIATVAMNIKIEVGKVGSTVYLRFNDYRLASYNIVVDSADINKAYYGSVMINKFNNENISLANIRDGGFRDTGNQIELSYLGAGRDQFLPYRSGGQTYLVIDRTGEGNFTSDSVDYIPSDEVDENRYKIIFNNIYWDTDGNSRDMFTFGYRQSNLVAAITKKDPICVDDTPTQSGQINIGVKHGYMGFTYNLINNDTKEERTGSFMADTLSIGNLPSGTYNLTLAETGGFNLYPKQDGDYANKALSSIYFISPNNSTMEWTVADETKGSAGLSMYALPQTNPSNTGVMYGLYCDNGNVHAIEGGTVSSNTLATVVPGDRIGVEDKVNKINYKLNGNVIYTYAMAQNDILPYAYAVAETNTGGIYNLKWTNIISTATWVTTDNMTMENSSGSSIKQTITLTDDCDKPVLQASTKATGSSLSVSSAKGSNVIDASLTLATPLAATFIVYDQSGSMISQKTVTTPQAAQNARLSVNIQGVYIVKAITNNGEYTQKILVK